MGNLYNLDNDIFLYILNSEENIPIDKNIISIENINLIKALFYKNFLLKIDFNSFNKKDYKKILKKLLKINNIFSKLHVNLGICQESKIFLGYILNLNKNDKEQNDFLLGLNAIFYKTKYERYNYIYDTVCNFLDSGFYGKNLCDFQDNRCGEKRNTSITCGCCRHYKNKILGPFSKLVPCEYLDTNKTCSVKCISCKLFTCDYLEKKGIKYKIKDILLLNTFFNPIQKYFIKYMVFTPKEKILKKLMFYK